MGLFLISGINLARYSAIIPSEKNISEDTKSISVIMKNWYLNTNNFSAVKTKYKINIDVDSKKLIDEIIVIKWRGLVLNEKIPLRPILKDPVYLLYFVSPSFLESLSNKLFSV